VNRLDVGLGAVVIGCSILSFLVAHSVWPMGIAQPMLALFVMSSLLISTTFMLTLRCVWVWANWALKPQDPARARPKVWPAITCLLGWASLFAPTPTLEIKVELPPTMVLSQPHN
jgi:hypothetical protein